MSPLNSIGNTLNQPFESGNEIPPRSRDGESDDEIYIEVSDGEGDEIPRSIYQYDDDEIVIESSLDEDEENARLIALMMPEGEIHRTATSAEVAAAQTSSLAQRMNFAIGIVDHRPTTLRNSLNEHETLQEPNVIPNQVTNEQE